jgi:hypothetical protein
MYASPSNRVGSKIGVVCSTESIGGTAPPLLEHGLELPVHGSRLGGPPAIDAQLRYRMYMQHQIHGSAAHSGSCMHHSVIQP